MNNFILRQIGSIQSDERGFRIALDTQFAPALKELEGFSHIQVLWWFSDTDDDVGRSRLQESSPYAGAPEVMGTFATRSPMRPNPIALSVAQVLQIDHEHAVIRLAYIDADDGTPLIDIKPYTPSLDRVETPGVPEWCAQWPKSVEASGEFDWSSAFNF